MKVNYRAKLSILNYISWFAIKKACSQRVYNGSNEYYFSSDREPEHGDLVALSSVRSPTIWYLSWYHNKVDRDGSFFDEHLLESIETGEFCNWSNVGFDIFNRKIVDDHPEWKWNDKQYKFNDQWQRACYRRRDAYSTLPVNAMFSDKDNSVVLSTRKRFGFGEPKPPKKFDNYKKVLVRDMLEYYDSITSDKA